MSTNGTPESPTSPLREEYRRARLELRLAEVKAQKRLLEGFDFGLGLPSFGGGWDWPSGPFVAPGLNGQQWWLPLGGGNIGRRDKQGDPPFIESEQQLQGVRVAARLVVETNQYAANVVETEIDFVLGERGITFRATTRNNRTAPDELIDSIQEVIDDFGEFNLFTELQAELVQRRMVDGEFFVRYYPQDDGRLLLRTVEPEHVGRPLGSPDNYSWGVITDPQDVQAVTGFAVHYGDADDWEEVPAGMLLHGKANACRSIKRGLSDFYATAEWFDSAKKLLTNACVGESVRAALVGFWEYANASSTTVASQVAARRDSVQPYSTHPISGKEPNYQRYAPGSIPNVPANKKFIPPPGSPNAQAQVGILQATLRSLGVRWGFPEYVVSGDASNANLASLLVSGAPFTRRIRRWQGFYRQRFLRVVWAAVKVAYAAGRLRMAPATWKELLGLVDIQAEAPPPELANDAEQATIDHADMDRGVLSIQTRRQRRGLDDEQETVNLQEKPLPAQQQAQQGQLGQPGQQLGAGPAVPQPAAGLHGMFPGLADGSVKTGPRPTVESRLSELRSLYGADAAAVVARAADAVLREGGQAESAGDDDAASLELIADILGGLFGEDALRFFDEDAISSNKAEEAVYVPLPGGSLFLSCMELREWSEADHPRGKGGRFIGKNSAEAVATAKTKVKEVLAGAKTPDSHRQLVEHLNLLSTKQLHDLRREYDLKASGQLKAQLVEKLVDRLNRGRKAGAAKPEGGGQAPKGQGGVAHPPPGTVRQPLKDADVPQHVQESGRKTAATVTPKEKAALHEYTAEKTGETSYATLNKATRACPDTLDCLSAKQRQVFDAVNGLATRGKLSEPVLVYRGVSLKGESKDKLIQMARESAASGKAMQFAGISSGSLDPEIAGGFGVGGVTFEIKTRSGAYIDPISRVGGEKEFLMPHGSKYRVVGVQNHQQFKNVGTTAVIQLEEI